MKIYELPESKDYQSFINFYRNVMEEGREEEAFQVQIQNIVYGKGTLMNLIVQTLEY